MLPGQATPVIERILAKTKKTETCWLWQGTAFSKAGHGRLYVGSRTDGTRRNALVHREAWKCFRGQIPGGLQVLHRCDVPNCVNPEHLFLGTATENMRDRDQKQRQARGSRQGLAKLTEQDVLAIREAHGKKRSDLSSLAKEYGVTYNNVRAVVLRQTWRHL